MCTLNSKYRIKRPNETALRGTSNWTRLRCQNAASALSHSVPARLGAVQGEPLASQLQPRRSLSGFGDSPAIRQRSVIGFGHARVLSVGNYQRRMWFRGQSCARGTGGMGYNHRTGQSEARTLLPLNSQYFMLFREFSRRHLAPSNAVLVASPGP